MQKVEPHHHFIWRQEENQGHARPAAPDGFSWGWLGRRVDKNAPDGKGWDIWWLEEIKPMPKQGKAKQGKAKQVIMCDDPQMLKAAIEVKHENGPVMQPRPQDADHPLLATNHQARKLTPIFSGVLRYFPRALAAVAALSQIGNEQHNPGTPLHWDRSKSGDEWDALTRHLLEVGTFDTDGVRHSVKVAWRALAGLEKEIEVYDSLDE